MSSAVFPSSLTDRFEFLGEIGAGGMGAVFRARDRELDREVAIKVILGAAAEEQRRRFLREADALARIEHPSLVRLFEAGEVEEGPYLVMELLDGVPLDELPDGVDRLEVMLQVADALEAVHAAGLIHRDVKPANILRTRDGRAVLLDLGIVRDPDASLLTREGMVLGTVPYMAPEVFREITWSPASDWYAWGATLFELLEGAPPWSTEEVLTRVARPGWPKPEFRHLEPRSDPARVVRACLSGSPSERPDSRAALEELLLTPPAEAAPTVLRDVSPSPPPAATRRWLPALALLVPIALLLRPATPEGPAPPVPAEAVTREAFLAPDLDRRLDRALRRLQARTEEPARYAVLWSEIPEVQSFRDWLRAGNAPEELEGDVLNRLRKADRIAEEHRVPRPFYPYAYESRGPQHTWLERAQELEEERTRFQERLERRTTEGDRPAELRGLAFRQGMHWIRQDLRSFVELASASPENRVPIARWLRPASDRMRHVFYALARTFRDEPENRPAGYRLYRGLKGQKLHFHADLLGIDPEAICLGTPESTEGLLLLGELQWARYRGLKEMEDDVPARIDRRKDWGRETIRTFRTALDSSRRRGQDEYERESVQRLLGMYVRADRPTEARALLVEVLGEVDPLGDPWRMELVRDAAIWLRVGKRAAPEDRPLLEIDKTAKPAEARRVWPAVRRNLGL